MKSVSSIRTWYSFFISNFLDVSVILHCCWMRPTRPSRPARAQCSPQVLLDVLLDGDPAVVYVDGRAEDVVFLKDAAILLQNHADQRHGLARFGRPEEDAGARNQGHHGVRGLLASVLAGKSLIFPIRPFALLPKFEAGKPGGESGRDAIFTASQPEFCGIKLKAGMHLKYMGSKSWLAPRLDLLGDISVLHSPFFGSGKLEYYLARRRPGLEVRGVDSFEPVANLHRCYLR